MPVKASEVPKGRGEGAGGCSSARCVAKGGRWVPVARAGWLRYRSISAPRLGAVWGRGWRRPCETWNSGRAPIAATIDIRSERSLGRSLCGHMRLGQAATSVAL